MKFGKIGLLSLFTMVFGASMGLSAERDPTLPRVPADQIDQARAWKNPFPATPENIAKGKALFTGKATCFTCHGNEGRGDGPAGAALDPSPRNFHNPRLKAKSDGEFFWVITNGSAGTGMISYQPGIVTEEEAALIILYERSLHDIP
ncbi:MAG: c-type cytochrome [Nitrospiria bacterium]